LKVAVLERIVADRAAKRAVVLVTDLQSGDQRLLYPFAADGEVATGRPQSGVRDDSVLVDDQLLELARMAARDDRSGMVEHGGRELLFDVFNPPVRLVLVGAAHIAQALAALAAINDFEVVVVDPRRAFATAERFPDVELMCDWPQKVLPGLRIDYRTAVVALSHDPKVDDPALQHAVGSPAFYVGALGGKRSHAARLERLSSGGCSGADLARVHGPVGLDIGARTPAEIATAILAQVIERLRGRRGS
jgi:xanthine dehydrogenase accessory factor